MQTAGISRAGRARTSLLTCHAVPCWHTVSGTEKSELEGDESTWGCWVLGVGHLENIPVNPTSTRTSSTVPHPSWCPWQQSSRQRPQAPNVPRGLGSAAGAPCKRAGEKPLTRDPARFVFHVLVCNNFAFYEGYFLKLPRHDGNTCGALVRDVAFFGGETRSKPAFP